MNYVTWGILAHVDAGKTTLSEAMLLAAGALERAGRVDKGDAFLDTEPMEKERGITIFSKQAIVPMGDTELTLLDTPGHVDFSPEMERSMQVMDGAILVISAAEGVQSHTRTLWGLLEHYGIPTIVFVNKMDMPGTDLERVMGQLRESLGDGCVDFSGTPDEDIALCDEDMTEYYLENGCLPEGAAVRLFYQRKLFPVWFGSALRQEGVKEFMEGIRQFLGRGNGGVPTEGLKGGADANAQTGESDINAGKKAADVESDNGAGAVFSGRVYKIGRDEKGERLTYLKVVSGVLRVRDMLGDEKVNGIRRYHGSRYVSVKEAVCGMVCAVTGPRGTAAGQGLGRLSGSNEPLLSPVISYRLILPPEVETAVALPRLLQLAEEEPDLQLEYEEEQGEIRLKLMGQVQTEILQRQIRERFGYEVTFGESRIVYRETIAGESVEGVGHFEPLRHYAEVHLLLEPGERGSGLEFAAECSEDVLDKNWQRLVLTHLRERQHRGVLTGSAITDMKITLVAGRSHPKHTEGGDFRQATYRAIRQGLMQAQSVLLEPYFDFVLEVPQDTVGRAMTDLERMHAVGFVPEMTAGAAILKGRAPVACIQGYAMEVAAYTGGLGRLALTLGGYDVCHNAEEVIEEQSYNPLADLRNTPDSVFCEHGSGVIVPWDQVKSRMHIPSALSPVKVLTDEQIRLRARQRTRAVSDVISLEEVDAILKGTAANKGKEFRPHKGINHRMRRTVYGGDGDSRTSGGGRKSPGGALPEYLLIDGYNIIFAREDLANLAAESLDGARGVLLDELCNYQAIRGWEVIAVFDAYRLQNHPEEFLDYHNIHVVFTKTAETADRYIERFANLNGRKYNVTVATSDGAQQVIVRGDGCRLMSARELAADMEYAERAFNEEHGVK